MDFKKATAELMDGMSREQIAEALRCSEATVRQARLDESNNAHRNPPEGWPPKLARIARQRAERLNRLAERLEKMTSETIEYGAGLQITLQKNGAKYIASVESPKRLPLMSGFSIGPKATYEGRSREDALTAAKRAIDSGDVKVHGGH